jgi:starch phosphorylase
MSLIEEGYEPKVRMAHLATVGSHSVNGVSELHTEILKNRVLADFHQFYPGRFNAKTNGVTPRRWLKKANSPLAYLLSDAIGDGWARDLDRLRDIIPVAEDQEFQTRWREVKRLNKERLASYVRSKQGIILDPETFFDCQVKRIHDYKRQFLNLLHAITLYNRIKAGAGDDVIPRTILFAGKAAPGYYQAKLIIRLVNAVADVLNNDSDVNGRLQVAFLANYGVSLAEYILPAAELSEQISTAGMEASGTGNMKLALNGALTIGTLDGANIEIQQEVGPENIFIFGLTAKQIEQRRAEGYNPWNVYNANPELRTALDQIAGGTFAPREPGIFQPLVDRVLSEGDPYMVLADYAAYVACQERVNRAYGDAEWWTRMSILNTACMGRFSSDRTIREYAEQIWHIRPIPVAL